jgi:hypothetical protein
MRIRMAEDYVFDSRADMMERHGLSDDDMLPPVEGEDEEINNQQEDDE